MTAATVTAISADVPRARISNSSPVVAAQVNGSANINGSHSERGNATDTDAPERKYQRRVPLPIRLAR